MDNLKWYWVYVPYLDEPDRQAESALRAGYNKVVFKSEADKVIAEKDKKIDLYHRGWEESDRINASIYAELRHQKYKRCLAMAEMCNARYDEEDAKVNGCGASWEYKSKEIKYWERWQNRWFTIAEKFKEDGK